MTKIEPFINKYEWQEINFQLETFKIEKDNVTSTINVLHAKNNISCLGFKT